MQKRRRKGNELKEDEGGEESKWEEQETRTTSFSTFLHFPTFLLPRPYQPLSHPYDHQQEDHHFHQRKRPGVDSAKGYRSKKNEKQDSSGEAPVTNAP